MLREQIGNVITIKLEQDVITSFRSRKLPFVITAKDDKVNQKPKRQKHNIKSHAVVVITNKDDKINKKEIITSKPVITDDDMDDMKDFILLNLPPRRRH